MKKALFLILTLSLLFSCKGGKEDGNSPIGPEKVKVEIDATNIRIGEQFTYKLSVDQTENVLFPELNLNGLELVEDSKKEKIENRLVKKYLITGFDSGAFYIPQQKLSINGKEIATDSLLVNVSNIIVDEEIKEFNIKDIKEESYQLADFMHLWWIGAIILIPLVIVLVVIFYFILRKKEKIIVPKLAPYDFALQQLALLDNKNLWQNNEIKEYYSELTFIIRTYIEDEFDVAALENTSEEIVKKLSRLHRKKELIAPNESLNRLRYLLKISDLVKFAKSKPLSNEIEQARKDVTHIINNIKQKQEILNDENTE